MELLELLPEIIHIFLFHATFPTVKR
jgi:hypothetical protein